MDSCRHRVCRGSLQLCPFWTCKVVHFYFATFSKRGLQKTTIPHPSSAFTWTQGVIQSDERWDETYIFSISLSPHRLRWHHHAMRPCQGLRPGNQYPQENSQHNAGRCGANIADSHENIFLPRREGRLRQVCLAQTQGETSPFTLTFLSLFSSSPMRSAGSCIMA